MTAVLAAEGLCKQFGDLTAVDQISFSMQAGLCLGLLGPNGAGKTTTLEMLEGLQTPTAGRIELFGQPASRALFQRLGIQFQNTALPDFLTTRETLAMFAAFYDEPMAIDELAELCALSDFIDQDARKLSGGQRQRLLLALALVNDPDLLFLDEPTTGLDPQSRRHFWTLIEAIKARGKSIVLTTHYMDEAEVLCDELVIMDKGRIIEQGSPNALLHRHFEGALVSLPTQNVQGKELNLPLQNRGERVEVLTDQVDQTLQTLINAEIDLAGMQIKTPNLDDLFLKLTGHALREA